AEVYVLRAEETRMVPDLRSEKARARRQEVLPRPRGGPDAHAGAVRARGNADRAPDGYLAGGVACDAAWRPYGLCPCGRFDPADGTNDSARPSAGSPSRAPAEDRLDRDPHLQVDLDAR